MAGIENRVYCSSLPFSYHRPLFLDLALIFSRAFHFRVIPTVREPGTDNEEAIKNTTLCKLHKVSNKICVHYVPFVDHSSVCAG